jgi:hypothetical protein
MAGAWFRSLLTHRNTEGLQTFSPMQRRERIRFTLERIKVARKLVAQQTEFIRLAKAVGYEPVHGPITLQRFRAQLADERAELLRLTRGGRTRLIRRPSRGAASSQR